jgi:accessory gene regulator protein AgrB
MILMLDVSAEWLVEMKFVFNLMLDAFSMLVSIAVSYRSLAWRRVQEGWKLDGGAVCTWQHMTFWVLHLFIVFQTAWNFFQLVLEMCIFYAKL